MRNMCVRLVTALIAFISTYVGKQKCRGLGHSPQILTTLYDFSIVKTLKLYIQHALIIT